MKKSTLILFSLITTTAFAYLNWGNSAPVKQEKSSCAPVCFDTHYFKKLIPKPKKELFYDFGPRFIMTITKDELNKVLSFHDIISEKEMGSVSYSSVSITLLDDHYNTIIKETGRGAVFTPAQLALLQSLDYSSDLVIRADYQIKSWVTNESQSDYTTPHFTVVPEKEAVYIDGKERLLSYVTNNTKEFLSIVDQDKVQSGKVRFTITQDGKISGVSLESSSGYPTYDLKIIELVTNMPGIWVPATNSKDEKVEQRFVLSFGNMGC